MLPATVMALCETPCSTTLLGLTDVTAAYHACHCSHACESFRFCIRLHLDQSWKAGITLPVWADNRASGLTAPGRLSFQVPAGDHGGTFAA